MYRNHSGATKHDAKRRKSKARTDCVRKETELRKQKGRRKQKQQEL